MPSLEVYSDAVGKNFEVCFSEADESLFRAFIQQQTESPAES